MIYVCGHRCPGPVHSSTPSTICPQCRTRILLQKLQEQAKKFDRNAQCNGFNNHLTKIPNKFIMFPGDCSRLRIKLTHNECGEGRV